MEGHPLRPGYAGPPPPVGEARPKNFVFRRAINDRPYIPRPKKEFFDSLSLRPALWPVSACRKSVFKFFCGGFMDLPARV